MNRAGKGVMKSGGFRGWHDINIYFSLSDNGINCNININGNEWWPLKLILQGGFFMKIKVIANKTWEADPMISAMLNPKFKPDGLPYPVVINQPRLYSQGSVHMPRLVYEINNHTVEVWCIEDQMNPAVSGSSTLEKIRILPDIINNYDETIDLVIAFGTAGHPEPDNIGSVSTGSYFFIHDGNDPSNPNPWNGCIGDQYYMSQVLHRDMPDDLMSLFTIFDPAELSKKFLAPPLHPSTNPQVLIKDTYMAVSDVNIIDYDCYNTEDLKAIAEAKKCAPEYPIGSVETTHGVIVANTFYYTQAPVVFVSALTDQVGHFNDEVDPKPEAQNFSAAFNGGIYMANILANLAGIS
jgi:hypothetical protein